MAAGPPGSTHLPPQEQVAFAEQVLAHGGRTLLHRSSRLHLEGVVSGREGEREGGREGGLTNCWYIDGRLLFLRT